MTFLKNVRQKMTTNTPKNKKNIKYPKKSSKEAQNEKKFRKIIVIINKY